MRVPEYDLQHAARCCAGGGGSRTPCGRSTAAPSQGCSVCGVCLARVHRVCSTAVFWGCSGTLGVSFGMQTILRGSPGERSWSLLGRIWGGPGGGLGGLGAPFGGSGAVLERSWAVLERSWRPSCGNVIFGCFLRRFWGRLGRPRGGQMEPKLEPKRTKIEDEKDDATRRSSRLSWGGLGAVLERS